MSRTSPPHSSPLSRRMVIVNVCAVLLVIALIAAVPTGKRVVVVAPPWAGPERMMSIIETAGGAFVGGGRGDWLAVAESNAPDFTSRLLAAGAVLILDGRLAAACITGDQA